MAFIGLLVVGILLLIGAVALVTHWMLPSTPPPAKTMPRLRRDQIDRLVRDNRIDD